MKAPGRAFSMKEKSSAPITGLTLVSTLVVADNLFGDRRREIGLIRVIARHRIAALVFEHRLGAVQLRRALDHLTDARFQKILRSPARQAARGAAQERRLRNDIVRRSGLEQADRHHSRMQRIDIARHDRLQAADDLRADQHRVDREMRSRRVPALALDLDDEMVGRRHQRARPDREFPERDAGIIVHPVDFLDPEARHQAVVDHRLAAGAAFLGRLEDHDRVAAEIAGLGEVFGGAKQHRGVPVMAAGMHLSGDGGLVGQPGGLLDRQRVHIGAHADGLARRLPASCP